MTAVEVGARIDAAPPPEPPEPPRAGCAKTGPIAALEVDPACAFHPVGEEVMRGAMRYLSVSATAEPAEVITGNSAMVTITIANTSSVERLVVLEARPRHPGPRTDWSRISGIPEVKGAEGAPHVLFAMRTVDARNHDVDALPTLSGSTPEVAPPTAIGIYLRPGGKITHTLSWWAMRIPAPAPIVKDDAGHRFVPKTVALPLDRGEYGVVIDVPLFALSPEERKQVIHVKVTKVPGLDGGTPR